VEIDYAVLADNGMPRPDGKFDIIGAGFDSILTQAVPARHARFVLVLRLLLAPDEFAGGHELAAELRSPTGGKLSRAGGVIPQVPEEFVNQLPAGAPASVGLMMAFENVVFPDFGDYTLALIWNGTETLALTIRVVELPRPA
jgi:hypothetical protein